MPWKCNKLREQETVVVGRYAMEAAPARVDRDWPIVEALRRRDPTAAERLVATYGNRAYRLAIRITGSRQDAEEAIQDAFWIVVRKIDTFRGDSGFGSWLYRIVANAAYGTLTSWARPALGPLAGRGAAGLRLAGPASRSPSRLVGPRRRSILQSELRIVLTAALDELPAEYRAVAVLRDVEGCSYREISEVLGITVASAKARVHRARLFLRKRLAGYMSPGRGGLTSGPRPARGVGAAVSSDDRSRARCHSRVAQARGPGDRRVAVVAASTCRGTCRSESGRRAQARGAERGGPYEPVLFRAPLQEEAPASARGSS